MSQLLELQAVYIKGSNKYRLQNINLSISTGEQIALLGENGSGKSTLIEVANGTLSPSAGRVKREWIPQKHSQGAYQIKVATLWQDLRLIDELTVAQNINSGALENKSLLWALRNLLGTIEKQTCIKLLEATGLPVDLLNSSITKLSGGQRQRVAIARLLRQQSDLLLADEPLTNLDPSHSAEILELLLSKKAINSIRFPQTSLISIHQPELIMNFTRVIGLKKGKLVWDKPPKDVFSSDLSELYKD